jgi:hypothetical protein
MKMNSYCTCDFFEEKGIFPEEIFKNFTPLSSSEYNKSKYSENGDFTSLLKCPKCKSYYLINLSNSFNIKKRAISITRYYPKVEEFILIKTIKSLEGIISSKELDECCDLSLTVLNILNKNKE